MMSLVSLELDPDESADAYMPIAMDHGPDYPYGMRVSFDETTMKKLGIDPATLKRDGVFVLHGLCRITSVDSGENESGKHFRMEAQIESAAIDGDDNSPAPAEAAPKKRARISYTGSMQG